MDNHLENKIKLEDLSKPITVLQEKKNFWERITQDFISKPKINISETAKPDYNGQIDRMSNASKSAGFFTEEKNPTKPEEKNLWIPSQQGSGQQSISWVISSALLVVALIFIVLASFGLYNMLVKNLSKNSISATQKTLSEAQQKYQQGDLNGAKTDVNIVLNNEIDNSEAKMLLVQINDQIGKKIIDQVLQYKSIDLTSWNHQIYQDPKQHYQVGKEESWQIIPSQYDVKLSDNAATYGIKKYPKVKSLTDLINQFNTQFVGKDYRLMAKKENTPFDQANAEFVVAEDSNNIIVTVLLQKYYYGYEISSYLPKDNYQDKLTNFEKILSSFSVNGSNLLESFDQLDKFGNEKITIHSWPGKIEPALQEKIISDFSQSLDNINKQTQLNWQNHLDIYLYPDWPTLYQYSLAENSFSDYINNEVHLVYENENSHQSFGYEPAKVIIQNSLGAVSEPLVIEGMAVMFDQTNRDYLDLVKKNTFIPLDDLLGVNWDLTKGDVKYFEAGVFAKYLIDKYGISNYLNLAKEKTFPDAYQKVYNLSLKQLESQMRLEMSIS